MLLDLVDAQGYIQLLRLHIVWLDRVCIGWRAEQQAGVGLEVEGFIQADHAGPGMAVDAFRPVKGKGRPTFGDQADGCHAGQGGDLVAPAAGCIDQRLGAVLRVATINQPSVAVALDAQHFAAGVDFPPCWRMPRR